MLATLITQGSLVDLAIIIPVLGAVIAYYRRAQSANWRDVAEQRLAAITDRDRQLLDQSHKMDALRTEVDGMRGIIARLEGEIAELKRHDLTSVIHMIEQLATATEQLRAASLDRANENALLFGDLRTHIFPMIQEIHAATKAA